MWRLALAQPLSEPLEWLTRAERAALASLEPGGRRADWCAGRVAAKRAVMELLQVTDPRRVEIASDARGAPVVSSHPAVRVSIAHRDARAVAVAAAGALRVGVDLERADSIASSRARYFLRPQERLHALSVTELWTVKEACWKALGCEPRLPFVGLELCFDASGQVVAASVDGIRRPLHCAVGGAWDRHTFAICLAPFVEAP